MRRNLKRVTQFAKDNGFTESQVRWWIFQSKERKNSKGETIPSNGLEASGAIVRISRAVFIDEDKFFDNWLPSQQPQQSQPTAA